MIDPLPSPWIVALVIDAAILLFVFLVLVKFFPARIRHGMKKNGFRLNGSESNRRQWIERRAFWGLVGNWLMVAAFLIFFGNVAIVVWHYQVMPIEITGWAVGQFHWDPEVWKGRLNDPSDGLNSEKFRSWSESRGWSGKTSLARALAYSGTGLCLALVGLIVLGFSIAKAYLNSLISFERSLLGRQRAYFMRDMQGRFERIEEMENNSQVHAS